jgi:hypothetical protein
MNSQSKIAAITLLAICWSLGPAFAIVNDARSYAIEAALPVLDAKPPAGSAAFVIRDAWWNGEAPVKKPKIFRHQLYKRNEYWFWAASDDLKAKISIAIYDSTGKLVKAEKRFSKDHTAGVKVIPETTGTYFVRVVIESASSSRARWAVVYGYR